MTADSHDKSTIIDLDPDQVTVERDDIAPSTPAESPIVAKRKTRLLIWALPAAALLLGAVGGGWLYRDYLSDYFPSDHMSAVIAQAEAQEKSRVVLQDQVLGLERLTKQLSADVDTLETKSATASASAGAVQDSLVSSDARLAGLESGLAETRQQLSDLANAAPPVATVDTGVEAGVVAAITAKLSALEKDVASLKASKGQSPDTTALSQSLADLKAKIAAGTGYAAELQRIQRMVPAAAGLADLAQYAEAGLPDAKGLAAALSALAAALPKPEVATPATADDSYLAQGWDMISGLIKVRDAGQTDWPAAASSAAALAGSGDLTQAIGQLTALEGDKPIGMQQWLERAAARVKLEAALQSVEEAVLRTLASQKAG